MKYFGDCHHEKVKVVTVSFLWVNRKKNAKKASFIGKKQSNVRFFLDFSENLWIDGRHGDIPVHLTGTIDYFFPLNNDA